MALRRRFSAPGRKGITAAALVAAIASAAPGPHALAYHQSRGFYSCPEGFETWDGSNAWTVLSTPRPDPNDEILEYAVNPKYPTILYVLDSGGGLFYTGDGGCKWDAMEPLPALAGAAPRVVQIVVPDGGRSRSRVLILLHDPATSVTSIVRSDNYGNEWEGDPQVVSLGGTPTELIASPKDPKKMYVPVDLPVAQQLVEDVPGPADRTIFYVTKDGGKSWELAGGPDGLAAGAAADLAPAAFVDVDVDPDNPNVLWAATGAGRVFRSADGAKTWKSVDAIKNVEGKPRFPAVVAAGPGGRVAVFYHGAVDSGLAYSENDGRTWSDYATPGPVTSAVFRERSLPDQLRGTPPGQLRTYLALLRQVAGPPMQLAIATDVSVYFGTPGWPWARQRPALDPPDPSDLPLTKLSVAQDWGRTLFGVPSPIALNPYELIGFNPFGQVESGIQDLTF